MNTEEITEYNKLCAEVLGFEISENKKCFKLPNKNEWIILDVFHSDWNWIMETLEAIEKLGFATKIDHNYCISNYGCDRCEIDTKENALYFDNEDEMNEPVVFELTKSKKEATINAINQFLIWYKEQTL